MASSSPATRWAGASDREAWFGWAMKQTAFFYIGAGDLMKSVLTGKAENVYGIIKPGNPLGRGVRSGSLVRLGHEADRVLLHRRGRSDEIGSHGQGRERLWHHQARQPAGPGRQIGKPGSAGP